MTIKLKCLTVLCFLSAASVAAAGPIVDAAGEAETLQAEGKTVEALQALDRAVDFIWNESPLAFRNVALVNSFGGFGVYEERPDATFKLDEKIMIYIEPVGFGYGAAGSSSNVGFAADLAIRNTSGQVVSEKKDLISLSAPSPLKKREFAMTFSFPAPFLRPGDYVLAFTVRDENSDKSGTFEIPVTLVLPASN
jgi:hypothetical protein